MIARLLTFLRRLLIECFLAGGLLLVSQYLWAAEAVSRTWQDSEPLYINENTISHPVDISQYVYFLEDKNRIYSIEQIQSGELDHLFHPVPLSKAKYYIASSLFSQTWFKLKIRVDESAKGAELYFPVHANTLHYLTMWIANEGVSKEYQLGFMNGRGDLPKRGYHFAVPLETGMSNIIGFADSKSAGLPVSLPVKVASYNDYADMTNRYENWIFGFYLVMVVLFLFNICIFFALRDRTYFVYLAFLSSSTMMQFFIDGTALRYFSAASREMLNSYNTVNGGLTVIFLVWFFYTSIDECRLWPRFNKAYIWSMVVSVLIIIFHYINGNSTYAAISNQIASAWFICLTLFTLIYCSLKKIQTAYILLIAHIGYIAGGTYFLLGVNGMVSYQSSFWSMHAALLMDVVFMSVALADKTRISNLKAINNLAKYEEIYDSTPQGLFSFGLSEKGFKCNFAWASMHGYTSLDDIHKMSLIGSGIGDHIENENMKSLMGKLFSQQEVSGLIYKPKQVDGSYSKTLILTLRMIKDANKKPVRIEGSCNDITAMIQRQEIANENAIIAARGESKNSFFASINHELRTPLTSILGYAQAVQGRNIPIEDKEEGLEIIEQSGRHLLQLINDLLDLSKIDAKKLVVEKIPLDTIKMFQEVEDYFAILAKNKNISFDIYFENAIPNKIESDPTRLKQIVINLCSNALKFTEKGFVIVEVSCDVRNQLLIVKVQDTGIGLGEEQMDNLFQAYSQADATITRRFGGTGLGLSLSKQLAELLGGDIGVSSTPNEGSVFTLKVATGDLSKVNFSESLPHRLSRPKMTTSLPPTLRGRVLYVEDNENTRNLFANLIGRTTLEVVVAENGNIAMEKYLESGPFDIVITDINMPNMDGISLCEEIHKVHPSQVVVAISALVNDEYRSMCLDYGFSAVIQKPVDPNDLYQMLNKYLGGENISSAVYTLQEEAKPVNVLLADDNKNNQQLIKLFLSSLNVKITLVSNGQEAIDAVNSQSTSSPFDVVLMDLHMPVLDGVNATMHLRNAGFTLPIIAFTASANIPDEYKDIGFSGFLSKPINKEMLLECISRFIKTSPSVPNGVSIPNNKLWDFSKRQSFLTEKNLKQLLHEFEQQLGSQLGEIFSSCEKKDWITLKKQLHQLKGVAGSYGHNDLTNLAEKAEDFLESEEFTLSEKVIFDIKDYWQVFNDRFGIDK